MPLLVPDTMICPMKLPMQVIAVPLDDSCRKTSPIFVGAESDAFYVLRCSGSPTRTYTLYRALAENVRGATEVR